MSEEGKFKKEIWKNATATHYNDVGHPSVAMVEFLKKEFPYDDVSTKRSSIQLETLFRLLDEARKDFPAFNLNLGNWEKWFEKNCHDCKGELPCPPCYKYQEWFLKWFGCAEK